MNPYESKDKQMAAIINHIKAKCVVLSSLDVRETQPFLPAPLQAWC